MSEQPLPDARPRSRPANRASDTPAPSQTAESQVSLPAPAAPPEPTHAYPFPLRPLINESMAQARAAQDYFLREMDPEPGMEAMLAMTLINQTRELNQLEKSKIGVIRLALSEHLIKIVKPTMSMAENLMDPNKADRIVNHWVYGGSESDHKELRSQLASIGLRLENVLAQGYSLAIDKLTKLDVMIDRTERRRDRSVRTFEYSRAIRPLVKLRHVQVRRANLALTADSSRADDGVSAGDTDRDV